MGLSLNDLDSLAYGTINDMMTEAGNDDAKYNYVATQADFDRW